MKSQLDVSENGDVVVDTSSETPVAAPQSARRLWRHLKHQYQRSLALTHKHTQQRAKRNAGAALQMLEQQTLKQACLQEYLQGPTQIQAPFGSLGSAIQYAYHTLLHPSSSPQPRHPMLKVVERTGRGLHE